jgi:hypothetical protein
MLKLDGINNDSGLSLYNKNSVNNFSTNRNQAVVTAEVPN